MRQCWGVTLTANVIELKKIDYGITKSSENIVDSWSLILIGSKRFMNEVCTTTKKHSV